MAAKLVEIANIRIQNFDLNLGSEAWERFKELLRACPHHGFTELTQVDTFYNGLNENEQDSLNVAAVKSMNATSSKTDERIDKLADQLSTLVEIVSKKVVTPAPVKAVEETCVTCGGQSWTSCKDSYDSNLDESTFLVMPLGDSNKERCLTPGDDIEFLLHHDPVYSFEKRCDNDEIDAFLAIEVPTEIRKSYTQKETIILESFLYHRLRSLDKILIQSSSPLSHNLHLIKDSGDSNREESDIFSWTNDSIPPGIKSDFDSGREYFISNLLTMILYQYSHLTFDMELDVPVINNGNELNEDECFDPGGGKINVEVDDSFTFEIRIFLSYLTFTLRISPLLSSTENEDKYHF
ncbi:hypothetical protein Tco_1107632 [Tanacetum coccineum]